MHRRELADRRVKSHARDVRKRDSSVLAIGTKRTSYSAGIMPIALIPLLIHHPQSHLGRQSLPSLHLGGTCLKKIEIPKLRIVLSKLSFMSTVSFRRTVPYPVAIFMDYTHYSHTLDPLQSWHKLLESCLWQTLETNWPGQLSCSKRGHYIPVF